MRRIMIVIVLALLLLALQGCAAQVLANPTDPAWDSLQVNGAMQMQSDLLLLAILVAPAAPASALVAITGRRK